MKVELRPLFAAEESNVPLDLTLDMSAVEIGGQHPLSRPVRFVGGVWNRAGVVSLEGTVSCEYTAPCDRCGEEATERVTCEVFYILVEEMAGEERDDYWVVADGVLDVDEVIRTDLLLALPSKHLCASDCKGLCSRCGANLNHGACSCPTGRDNPFADALANFFD